MKKNNFFRHISLISTKNLLLHADNQSEIEVLR